jgi:hypothetical protein
LTKVFVAEGAEDCFFQRWIQERSYKEKGKNTELCMLNVYIMEFNIIGKRLKKHERVNENEKVKEQFMQPVLIVIKKSEW